MPRLCRLKKQVPLRLHFSKLKAWQSKVSMTLLIRHNNKMINSFTRCLKRIWPIEDPYQSARSSWVNLTQSSRVQGQPYKRRLTDLRLWMATRYYSPLICSQLIQHLSRQHWTNTKQVVNSVTFWLPTISNLTTDLKKTTRTIAIIIRTLLFEFPMQQIQVLSCRNKSALWSKSRRLTSPILEIIWISSCFINLSKQVTLKLRARMAQWIDLIWFYSIQVRVFRLKCLD